LRWVKFLPYTHKLWLRRVHAGEVTSSQVPFLGREAKPEIQLQYILNLAMEG
jgi:hypothetical protein